MLAACAVQPPAPAPATTTLAPAAAVPGGRTSDAKYAAFARSARNQGYRPVRTDGKEVWCREGSSLDSRLARQSCISAPTLAEAPGAADDASDPPRKGE